MYLGGMTTERSGSSMYLGGITNERSEGETEKVYKMYTFDQFYAVHSELGFNSVNSKQTNKQKAQRNTEEKHMVPTMGAFEDESSVQISEWCPFLPSITKDPASP